MDKTTHTPYHIIANPVSGKSLGTHNLERIKSILDNRGIPYDLHISQYAGHSTILAHEVEKKGADKIIALGGDGTFCEVMQGIKNPSDKKFGFIPSGTGNDFAYAMKLSNDPTVAIEQILDDHVEPVDYIQVGDHKCLNICATGLDIEVLKLYNAQPKKTSSTYTKCLLKVLRKFKFYKLKITIDEEIHLQGEYLLVACCNGTRFGATLNISPLSEVQDGVMNLILVKKISRIHIPFALYGLLKSRHLNKPYVEHYLCKSVRIENIDGTPLTINIDGQLFPNADFTANIVPNGINCYVPTK